MTCSDGSPASGINLIHRWRKSNRQGMNASSGAGFDRRYSTIAILVVMMGVMMTAVDTTAVVLGLPVMMHDLQSSITSMVWVIMAYLLILAVVGTQVGRLGDMYGRVRMYNLGFVIFTVGSLLCGLALNDLEIIAFRVLQGLGGAFIFANSGAIIADTFPPAERGRAYGYSGVGFSAGAVLGILVGGAFVTFLTWRYIFFINVPIGTVAALVGYMKLHDRAERVKRRLDPAGIVLLMAGIFLILYSMTDMAGGGLTERPLLELLAGLGIVMAFIYWETKTDSPLLDLSMMKQRVLFASMFAAFFQAIANFAVLFLIIMYLQGPRGLSPWNASLLLVPAYILSSFVAPVAGRMSDRVGARVVASLGLFLQAAGIFIYSTLGQTTPLEYVLLGAVVNGVGSSMFFPANNSAVMASAPQGAYGITSGLLRTLSNIGMVVSFAVALLIASLSIPRQLAFEIFLGVTAIQGRLAAAFIQGIHVALLASVSLIGVAIALSILRGREARTQIPRPAPAPVQGVTGGERRK